MNLNVDIGIRNNECFPFTESSHKPKFLIREIQTRKGIKKQVKRKEKNDDIKKKLKATFLKALKNKVNEKLSTAGSKKFFDFLPQRFVTDVSRKFNMKYLKTTIYEIWNTDFSDSTDMEMTLREKLKQINKDKYLNNHKVLEYLDKNLNISKESGFDIIKNMTYKELYDAYIKSEEFWNSIKEMGTGRKPSSPEYIKKFINVANYFIQNFKKGIVE